MQLLASLTSDGPGILWCVLDFLQGKHDGQPTLALGIQQLVAIDANTLKAADGVQTALKLARARIADVTLIDVW